MPTIPTMYNFSPKTGEFTGKRPAQVINGKPLIKSAYATTTPPPENIPDGHVARWTGDAWETVEDHRQYIDENGTKQGGTPYWLPDLGDSWQSQARYMEELGRLPAGAITVRPDKPAPTKDELFQQLRAERDRRIAATDFMIMADYPIPADQRTAVQIYRQALRDLPAQDGAPWDGGGESTPWPDLPAGI